MQPFQPQLDWHYRVQHQLSQHLLERIERRSEAATRFKKRWNGVAEVAHWRQACRQAFVRAVGGLPAAAGGLNPALAGTISLAHYRIEKVIFQSQPGNYVAANLYVPNQHPVPAPAVLFLCGHARDAKAFPPYQQVCSLLAKNGLIVLAMDPIGQGERLQCIDQQSGQPLVGWCTAEHIHLGLLCTITGTNLARYMVADAMRGIDFLLTRPEVDPNRIGVTGNSGGGTQASYLILVDDRPAAAAIGTFITSRCEMARSGVGHDAEQNLFDAVGHLDYDDFLIAFAPKPLHILAAAYDSFPIEGTWQAYASAQHAYTLHGAANCLKITVDEERHEFTPALRKAAAEFFVQTFQASNDVDFEAGPILDPSDLRCTQSGQLLRDRPELMPLSRQIILNKPKAQAVRGAQLRERVVRLVHHADRQSVEMNPRIIRVANDTDGIRVEKLFFFSEPKLVVAGVMLMPPAAQVPPPVTLVLLPDGTASLADTEVTEEMRAHCMEGKAVLVFDPRGVGAVAPEFNDRQVLGRMFKHAYESWMLGDNIVCMRAYDVLRSLQYLRRRTDVDGTRITILARGEAALAGLLAAVAAGARVEAIEATGLPRSWAEAVAEGRYDRTLVNEWTVLHGTLGLFDLEDLHEAARSR